MTNDDRVDTGLGMLTEDFNRACRAFAAEGKPRFEGNPREDTR